MTPEAFLEKFDLIASAPNAVAKMRELIFFLAPQGKLVPQDLSEHLSSKFLGEPSLNYLPENWRLLNFEKFCDIQGGNQPPKSEFLDHPKTGYVRLYQIRDLGEKSVPTYILATSTNRFCKKGDILIGRYGASVGKIFWGQDGAYNVALAKFCYPPDALLPEFAFISLKSNVFQYKMVSASRSAQAGFNKGDLAEINFPLPPLAEQKRIVAKVDELMALCDRLEAQQNERIEKHKALSHASITRFSEAPTPENLNFLFHPSYTTTPANLRKTILTLAIQGKLVPQDTNDEPAEADFESLVRDCESSSLKRTKIDGEARAEDPLIPDSWLCVSLGEVVSIRTGFAFKSGDYAEEGTFILRVTNINPDGSFDTINSVFLPDSKLDMKMKGFLLEEHELLVVMVGGSLGKIGQVTAEILPALLNQNMWRLKPYSEKMDFRFLRLVLHDLNENRLQITASTHGHLAMGTYAAAKVPFPPLAEQKRIVAKVDELMALVDQLESQLKTAKTKAEKLLDAVVADLTSIAAAA